VVSGTDDFDGDGHPDFLLYNFNTRETAIDYLSNNVLVNAAMGPTLATLPLGWVSLSDCVHGKSNSPLS
jgi:hypothetical protein